MTLNTEMAERRTRRADQLDHLATAYEWNPPNAADYLRGKAVLYRLSAAMWAQLAREGAPDHWAIQPPVHAGGYGHPNDIM